MIKIIKGYYGYKQGNSIVPKTSKDAPFECDKAEEARLVKLGVAEYVETEVKSLYTEETGLAELKEIAKTLGATDEELKPIRSKAAARELIDKLADEIAEGEPVDGPDESEIVEVDGDEPAFDEVDGVVE